MPVICDTSSVPVEDRAELQVTASSELFVPLECTPHHRAAAPWGGVKASGWGREMGKDAIDLYTEVKNVWVSLT